MKWWASACKPGDMIRVRASGVWHYGIYVSDDEVIQFGLPPRGDQLPQADIKVLSTRMDEFAGDDFAEVAQLNLIEKLKRRSPKATISFARSKIDMGGYDIINNNCEHFANLCVFNRAVSVQADSAKSLNGKRK